MFSLIITVISIALVAALALATLYYGGTAFNKGAARAEASKLLLQGQQLVGAADLYYTDHREWPTKLEDLVTQGYLKQIPVAQGVIGEAQAASVSWTMPIDKTPMFVIPTAGGDEVCAEVNLAGSLRQRGVLTKAYTNLVAQCYGSSATTLKTVFKKAPETALHDYTTGTGLPVGEIVVGNPPGGDNAYVDFAPRVTMPNTTVGQTSTGTTYVKNLSDAPITVTGVTASSAMYSVTLAGTPSTGGPACSSQPVLQFNELCHLDVIFSPTAAGPHGTTLTLNFTHSGNAEVSNSAALGTAVETGGGGGTPPPPDDQPGGLTLTPATVTFMDTAIGSSMTGYVTVTNTGAAPVTLSAFTPADATVFASGLAGSNPSCASLGGVVPNGQSCNLSVTFAPTSATTFNSTVTLTGSDGLSKTINVSGKGLTPPVLSVGPTGALQFVPSTLYLGTMPIWGSIEEHTVSLVNNGTGLVNISAITLSGDPDFDMYAGYCQWGTQVANQLQPREMCNIYVSFTPSTLGTKTATINVTHDGTGGTATLNMGADVVAPTGVEPPPPSSLWLKDTFTAPDGSRLVADMGPNKDQPLSTAHVADIGLEWYSPYYEDNGWGDCSDWYITGGAVKQPDGNCQPWARMTFNRAESPLLDYDVSAEFTMPNTDNGLDWWLIGRVNPNQNCSGYGHDFVYANVFAWDMDLPTGQVLVELGSCWGNVTAARYAAPDVPLAAGIPHTLRLVMVGTRALLYIDTKLVLDNPDVGSADPTYKGGAGFSFPFNYDKVDNINAGIGVNAGQLPPPWVPRVQPMCTAPVYSKVHLAGGYEPNRLGVDQFVDPPGWYAGTYYPTGWAYELMATGATKEVACP